MPRLIDADALSTKVIFVCEDGYDGADMVLKKDIDNAPTIEAEPVKHGKWDDSGRYAFGDGSLAIRCSECGCALHEDEYQKYYWNYCPNCGAKMQGGADHED